MARYLFTEGETNLSANKPDPIQSCGLLEAIALFVMVGFLSGAAALAWVFMPIWREPEARDESAHSKVRPEACAHLAWSSPHGRRIGRG